jgi:hypothetical protein
MVPDNKRCGGLSHLPAKHDSQNDRIEIDKLLARQCAKLDVHRIPSIDGGKSGTAVLSACPRVADLWITDSIDSTVMNVLFPLIEDLPLTSLTCNLHHLFGRAIDFTHRLFAQITHLKLFDWPSSVEPEIWHNLALIPHLTHLAFTHPTFITVCLTLLQTCPSLRVLVCVGLYQMQQVIDGHRDEEELVKDPRFVLMNHQNQTRDWQVAAHTGNDYWSRAEDFVAKRRSGEIDRELLIVPETAAIIITVCFPLKRPSISN